jgi:hypothetical protein
LLAALWSAVACVAAERERQKEREVLLTIKRATAPRRGLRDREERERRKETDRQADKSTRL